MAPLAAQGLQDTFDRVNGGVAFRSFSRNTAWARHILHAELKGLQSQAEETTG